MQESNTGLALNEKSKGGLFKQVSPGDIYIYTVLGERKRGPGQLGEGPNSSSHTQ